MNNCIKLKAAIANNSKTKRSPKFKGQVLERDKAVLYIKRSANALVPERSRQERPAGGASEFSTLFFFFLTLKEQ